MEDRKLYNFYKTPDGEDCLQKVYFATKYTTVAGLTMSFLDIGMVTFPKTIAHGLGRIAHYTLPYAGMGVAFASTACLAGRIRKKNDFFNHALGGLAAGTIYGAKHGCAIKGGQLGGVLALILGTVKYFKDNNYPFGVLRSPKHKVYNPNFDFSIKLYDDPGRPDDP